MDKDQAIQEYVLAKNTIQLTGAILEECHVKKSFTSTAPVNLYNDLNFGYQVIEGDEKQIEAVLKVLVRSSTEDGTVILEMDVSYRGTFEAYSSVDMEDLKEFVEVQTVPQLLPYARTFIVSMTAQMGIEPITLPTMDIIQSIIENATTTEHEEQD